MKILVAEDDMASGKFMMKLLAKYGEVVLARDGIAAVDEFVNAVNTNERFDLICMDVMMPKMDIRHLRQSVTQSGSLVLPVISVLRLLW